VRSAKSNPVGGSPSRLIAGVLVGASVLTGCSCSSDPNSSGSSASTLPPDSGDDAATDGGIDWDVVGEDAGFYCFVSQVAATPCDGGQFVGCVFPQVADAAIPLLPSCTQVDVTAVDLTGPAANIYFCCP
jgi:hypothetical protein